MVGPLHVFPVADGRLCQCMQRYKLQKYEMMMHKIPSACRFENAAHERSYEIDDRIRRHYRKERRMWNVAV